MNLVTGYLSGQQTSGNDNYLVTVHVDQSALAGKDGRAGLPIETVKRLCCDSQVIVITEDDQGEPLSIGRKSRIVPKAIQRAVRARDHDCCTFPGCNHHRFLHCHHVSTGRTVAQPPWIIFCCSARSITRWCTRAASGSRRIIATNGSS